MIGGIDDTREEDDKDVVEDAGDDTRVSGVLEPQLEVELSFSLAFCRLSTLALATAFWGRRTRSRPVT